MDIQGAAPQCSSIIIGEHIVALDIRDIKIGSPAILISLHTASTKDNRTVLHKSRVFRHETTSEEHHL
jgi:hypothetical protein